MRIWLLNPPYKSKLSKEGRCEFIADLYQTIYPPLSLAYLAAILRKKYEVSIIDAIASQITLNDLYNRYLKEKPEIIFVNTSTPTIDNDTYIIKKLYSLKKARFYIFGIHVKYFNKEFSNYKEFEIITDEVEKFAFELIGEKNDLKHLDSLPFPAWDLIDLDNYKMPLKNEKFVLLQTARGCPYNCTFCTAGYYYGKKVRERSVDSIINEIKYDVNKLGINHFLFYSETFTLNKRKLMSLCKRIIRENIVINWMCNSRVDTVDKEMLKYMKQSGCWVISFGIESGSQRILDTCKKGITLPQIENTVTLCQSMNILTLGHFILGLPGEDKNTIQETLKFSRSLGLDFAFYYIATPFPGSELYESTKFRTNDWAKYEYNQSIMNTNLDLINIQKKATKDFYLKNFSIFRLFRLIRVLGFKNFNNILKSGLNLIYILLVSKNKKGD